MRNPQTMLETHVLEFSDQNKKSNGCKVTLKVPTTRNAMRITKMVLEKNSYDDFASDPDVQEKMWEFGVANIEAPDVKFKAGGDMGEYMDLFEPVEVVKISNKIMDLTRLSDEEKKTSS